MDMRESEIPTPYAVRCWACNKGEPVFLTQPEYWAQMSRPDYVWMCPRCNKSAQWDDYNYEKYQEF